MRFSCRNALFSILVFVSLLATAGLAQAAISITADRGAGDAVVVITGAGFYDVGGVDITLEYEDPTLINAQVVQGNLIPQSMSFMANSAIPGRIKIVGMSLSPVSGSGTIATITFAKRTNLLRLSAEIASPKGYPMAATTRIDSSLLPPAPVVQPDAGGGTTTTGGETTTTGGGTTTTTTGGGTTTTTTGGGTTTTTTGGGTTTTTTGGGTTTMTTGGGTTTITGGGASTVVSGGVTSGSVTLPTDLSAPEKRPETQPIVTDLRRNPSGTERDKSGEGSGAGQSSQPSGEKKFLAYKGALQLFKEFKDAQLPKNLIGIFADVSTPDVKQEPPIAIADGKGKILITVTIKAAGDEPPNFALQGAKMLNLTSEDDSHWLIEALPKKGVYEVTLTVSDANRILDVPLTVVPPVELDLDKSGKVSEADFTLFLKEQGTAKVPKFDLNGDGKRDAIDDYIFTANYIVAMKIKPVSVKAKETKEPKAKAPAKGGELRDTELKQDKGVSKPPVQDKPQKKPLPPPAPPSGDQN